MNINRDYLIINDVKKSNITLDNGSMFFYITDKNTQNIFVNLVINISNNDLIQKYANIENAEDYTLTMHIVKPDNTYKIIEGKLHDKEKAIFEFNLNEDCCDEIGTYRCELLTKCNIDGHEEVTTSNKLTYKVKSSVLNDLDEITEAPEYPLVIQLFDKLSDIEQYEEDRRANELARQLAEEQRQTRFNELDADMTDSIQAMDNKVVEVENRVSAKEEAVDKLIVDTKADINEYKVAKDQEIDDYKAAKDTEINNAITAQDNKIDEAISNQNDRIVVVENNVVAQNDKLDTLENKVTTHETRITATEAKNAEQDGRLDVAENRLTNIGNDITNTMQPIIDAHTSRLDAIEAIDVAQNTRLDNIEVKNQQQDERLLNIEKVNKKQDMDIKCLFNFHTVDITEEGNSVYLPNSAEGHCEIDNIQGNTLVNCNKEPDKELILNSNINTSGDNAVTLTEGVDGGLVDVALEGNTLVNVSKTKDSTAITKAYTVENSGNHITLQGDVDGSCRPVITGNTLVNLIDLNFIDKEPTSNSPSYVSSANKEIGWDWSIGQRFNDWVQVGNKLNIAQPNKTYTLIANIKQNNPMLDGELLNREIQGALYIPNCNDVLIKIPRNKTGIYKWVFTATENTSRQENKIGWYIYSKDSANNILINGGKLIVRDIMLLEGDYSDKPIPDYFEGLQSTFEDNLVTQEMVDSGEEVVDNLGKYRVDYISTQQDGTVGSTKTLYLNSPLLEGDTIEEKDGGIYHVHRHSKVVLDGSENWINSDNNYAYISLNDLGAKTSGKLFCDTLILGNALSGDIFIGTAGLGINYNDTNRTNLTTLLSWLQSNPVTVVYELASPTYELIEQSNLAIPSYTNGHLDFNTAVPVEKVEFKPFSEELTYLYASTQYTVQFVSDKTITADITLGGTQLLAQSIVAGLNRISITTPSELVDNKLIIDGAGAKISEVVVTDTDREFGYFEGMKSVGECEELAITSANSDNSLSNTQRLIHEPLRAVGGVKDRYVMIDGKWYIERNCDIREYQEGDKDNYKTDLVNTVYPLDTPTYEEIDYNPLEVYSGTTHISTNSTIPTNIIVKNHGYNCLLKPSTTYTISSNLGLNTVTTPSTLTEDCLRFMDTDTSDVTTMKDVLVLEGDWTTKGDLIPANFSGIESAFEQEYDAEKGKYKVNVKVANEDKTKENNITFYINEPLRGVGDAKDRVFIKDDKVVVQRNCGIRPYEDGDFDTYPTDKVDTVYPLVEPTYEEVEYNDTKLFIESFKNSTLFYNSNVPVTSTVHYSYSVPIVDTVAQTANVTDQQDSMIIDLATQVAVMEMMLM